MAIDTRNRRASCLGIDGGYRQVLPNPDGAISQPDRQQCGYKYPGIVAAAPGGTVLIAFDRSQFRRIFGRIFGRIN